MMNLIQFMEEDVLDAMLLEPVDDWQLVSPTPEVETTLLCEPQEAEAEATCPPWHEEWAPEPENAAKQMEMVTEPQGMQVCLPPPGFKSPPPEQDIPLIWIPNPDEAQSGLTPVSTMNMVVYENEIMGNLGYEYKTHYLEPLQLESPDHRPKITECESWSE